MGRFNWMWKAVQRPGSSWAGNQIKRIALIAASLLLSTPTADALSSEVPFTSETTDGLCYIDKSVYVGRGSATVALDTGAGTTFAGGARWHNMVSAPVTSIANATMHRCFSDYTDGTLIQKGADAASFETQELMGFGYVSAVTREWDEHVVGEGTLQPVPKILSAAYNASTGELRVTGQNMTAAPGAMNDIKANKLSLTGEGGATYALTDTDNVEISSSTEFTITLSATDKGNLRELLNKNGSTSIDGTTYNLAAAEDWAVGADDSLTIADLSGNAVTVSNIVAPTLSSVSIASNNATTTLAVSNNVVTLTFTASEPIASPVVTFLSGGSAITDTSVTYDNTSGNTWTAAYTANASDTAGSVTYSIAFSDTAGNAGSAVTSGTGSVTYDGTAPTLSSVSIASNNATTTLAVSNNVVTLTFTASEPIASPVVTFLSGGSAITDTSVTYDNTSGNTWTAAYTANASDTAGSVTYSIAFSDTAGNAGSAVTSGTGSVTYDGTAPTLSSVSIASNNATTTLAVSNNVVTLTFTASEPIASPVVTFLSGGSAITDTSVTYDNTSGNTWTAAYTANASDTAGSVTYSIAFSDTAGNAGSAVTSGTGSVTYDGTAPTLSSATYNASTGELRVTGQNMTAAPGAMNDIKANKLSLTGEGGATYALTDTDNVEISSSTEFTITLSATDKGNLRELLNKNGSTSIDGTTYNLAAAEDWAVGADDSLTIADLSGNAVTVSNIVASSAPTAFVATPGDGKITVAFTAPSNDGGATITNYEYSMDGGTSYTAFSPTMTSSPVVITGLINGTSYSIKLRAVNSAGDGTESDAVTSTPAATSNAPTALVATPGDAQVSVAFTAPTSNGGAAITDYEYQLDGGAWTSSGKTSSPVVITGLTNGTSYSIKLRAVNSAGNGAESAAVSVLLGSPASAFDEAKEEVQAIITQDATRSLTSTLSSNQRMTRGARSRFIESRGQGEGDGAGLATRNNVPFDVDGTFDLAGARVSSKGTFFGQTGNVEGTERRLVFGEFDLQHDGNTDSTTATLTGRMAWEQMYGDQTMLGYFIGGELAHSNIKGSFEGEQDRLGLTFGGYAVHQLDDQLFLDGFITLGAGRNDLEMANDVLALTSDYTTRTATVGAALSGVYEYEQYEFRPELAFSYGKTWIGDVGFTGVAYGLTDNTLSLDAGNVSIANLTLRPEVVWALDADTVAGSNAQLSFAPRFICERTTTAATTQNCGAGAEIGLSSNSEDGLSSANIRFVMDRVGNSNRSNVVFNVEQRF